MRLGGRGELGPFLLSEKLVVVVLATPARGLSDIVFEIRRWVGPRKNLRFDLVGVEGLEWALHARDRAVGPAGLPNASDRAADHLPRDLIDWHVTELATVADLERKRPRRQPQPIHIRCRHSDCARPRFTLEPVREDRTQHWERDRRQNRSRGCSLLARSP